MMNATQQIDWNAIAERAKGMTMEAIRYTILDIQATLPSADSMDLENGGCRGGYYRDEISIYRREYVRKKAGK